MPSKSWWLQLSDALRQRIEALLAWNSRARRRIRIPCHQKNDPGDTGCGIFPSLTRRSSGCFAFCLGARKGTAALLAAMLAAIFAGEGFLFLF